MARNPDKRRCGATTRSGRLCRRWAAAGRRYCTLHEGAAPGDLDRKARRPPGRPPEHGIRSKRLRESLRDVLANVHREVKLDSVETEIRYLKARLHTILTEATTLSDPRLSGPTGEDVVGELVERIARLVARRHRTFLRQHESRFQMSVLDAEPLLLSLDQVIDECVEPERQQAAKDRFEALLEAISILAVS